MGDPEEVEKNPESPKTEEAATEAAPKEETTIIKEGDPQPEEKAASEDPKVA
jgi:hypothetical protein